jgi:hypothetical protein
MRQSYQIHVERGLEEMKARTSFEEASGGEVRVAEDSGRGGVAWCGEPNPGDEESGVTDCQKNDYNINN